MRIKKVMEGGVYCADCMGELPQPTSSPLSMRYPAADEGKGTCWGCGKTVELRLASKVLRREKK